MPNHVINEVVFRNVDAEAKARILSHCLNADGVLSFAVLLPLPLNYWNGNVSSKHEERFPGTGLDWCSKNWSTKWDAYGDPRVEATDDTLTLTFQTAWGPPQGWLCALFNATKLDFTHRWFSEGGESAHVAEFVVNGKDGWGAEWNDATVDDGSDLQRHLHKLLYGVEQFEDESEDVEQATA